MKVCKCHGYAADWDEAAQIAFKTKRNVQVCPTPKPFAVAMDASSHSSNGVPNSMSDLDETTKAKIRRVKAKMALDAEADRKVKALFPALALSVAMDDMEAEQEAQGSFSSEEEAEASDEDNTFGAGYAASLKATQDYWNKVKSRKPSATYEHVRGRSNKPVAVDHVAANARKARSFSLFDTAKTIIKRQKKSA